jgi:hypothetical protein
LSAHSKAAKSLAKQEQDIAREKQWWNEQEIRVQSGDLVGYYENYIKQLEARIKEVGGFSSRYREICLAATKATLIKLKGI